MNFLNEVASQYPQAASLASGRPLEWNFSIDLMKEYQDIFCNHVAEQKMLARIDLEKQLCQYGNTAGIINELLCQHLSKDENITCNPDDILVTNGCQEALALLALEFCKEQSDVLLAFEPSYIGFVGACSVTRTNYETIPQQGFNVCFDSLSARIEQLRRQGKTPKALYINPDFSNPLGTCLTESERKQLLSLCYGYEIAIIEDNPYGQFYFSENKQPTLKALDTYGLVYYVGSFAKTITPSLRIGYVVCPQNQQKFYQALKIGKSMVSVNTSQLMQAVVGGFLIKHDFSLNAPLAELRSAYLDARNIAISVLQERLSHVPDINWNSPDGGFFLLIMLPFIFTAQDVAECASKHDVICMPVSFFTSDDNKYWEQTIRIAYSNVTGDKLRSAVQRLCDFILYKMSSQK
jgi:(S)-3,5-dihydroxyphenylglycine transaminase